MNLRELMSHVSGFTESEVQSIFDEVKANSDRLRNCQRPHHFERFQKPNTSTPHFRGSLCRGEIDYIRYAWYREGVQDGAKR
jgi:hypothetical protein